MWLVTSDKGPQGPEIVKMTQNFPTGPHQGPEMAKMAQKTQNGPE